MICLVQTVGIFVEKGLPSASFFEQEQMSSESFVAFCSITLRVYASGLQITVHSITTLANMHLYAYHTWSLMMTIHMCCMHSFKCARRELRVSRQPVQVLIIHFGSFWNVGGSYERQMENSSRWDNSIHSLSHKFSSGLLQ